MLVEMGPQEPVVLLQLPVAELAVKAQTLLIPGTAE
jgi:hypothetical protein